MKKNIRKSLHIKILKYAWKKGEFLEKVMQDDLNFSQRERKLWNDSIRNSKQLCECIGDTVETEAGHENLWTISTEGWFKLLEYRQLHWARVLGFAAIVISSLLAVATITIQIVLPTRVENKYLANISEIQINQENISETVSDLLELEKTRVEQNSELLEYFKTTKAK